MQGALFFGNKNDANAIRNNLAELKMPSLSRQKTKYNSSGKYERRFQDAGQSKRDLTLNTSRATRDHGITGKCLGLKSGMGDAVTWIILSWSGCGWQ
jgi:hypothetical protein